MGQVVVESGVPRSGRDAPRCALIGDEPLVEQCADLARAHGLDVVLIATTNDMVREYAVRSGIALVEPAAIAVGLDANPADVLFSIANLRVLADDVIDRVGTAINFHDGPLPGYAGLNVTTWALLAGEREHAVTWHVMSADVDAGDIVATERFPVAENETAFSLNARCYEAALASFPRVAASIAAGTLSTETQAASAHRLFRRHDRPAIVLDPTAPAAESARAVHALDLGHRLRNTVGAVRLVLGDDVYVVESADVAPQPSGAPAGTVVSADGSGARVATRDGDLMLSSISTATGAAADVVSVLADHGVSVGDVVPSPPAGLTDAVTELEPALAKDEGWWLDRLGSASRTTPRVTATGERTTQTFDLPAGADGAAVVAAVAVWLAGSIADETVSVAVTDRTVRSDLERIAPLAVAPSVMLDVPPLAAFATVRQLAGEELAAIRGRRPLLLDAIGRDPSTRGRQLDATVLIELDADLVAVPGRQNAAVRIALGVDGRALIDVAHDRHDEAAGDRVVEQLTTILDAGLADPTRTVADLPLIGPLELAALDELNATSLEHDRSVTIDSLFHAQVGKTPDAAALTFEGSTITYTQLESAVDRLAVRLAAHGVGRGGRVGIALPRGIDMVVGVLATLARGAAYVPLDPTYPIERLSFMVDDAGIVALLAVGDIAVQLGRPGIAVVDPAAPFDGNDTADSSSAPHEPTDLAYLIYTSGSTGVPKGVMLEHRNVVNFFAAMDGVIDHDPPGVWLAVTSLSFDISVLELLWTLTRGFHVVLAADRGMVAAPTVRAAQRSAARPVSFSLFYFAAGDEVASDGYRLLLDSARFADRHGFEAVWTPERHFHAFGAAYPNPSVTAAALAAVTSNVGIRAGSVVLPLHSPIRVAEEWAVVDNLSRGRVAISFAAGWQPNDFVLNPTAFATAKEDLPRSIDLVRRLWRGETVAMVGHDGAPVDVQTLPRPVQAELPVWLTSAGSPATFERAGALGVNVLTHLLGQSVEQLGENIGRYRAARRAAGHDGEGRVTLMMHTFLDRDGQEARRIAHQPMKGYLGTAVGLLRDVASAFPTFAGRGKGTDDLLASLSAEEMDQLLDVAADRYLGTSGLFGTPDDAAEIVEAVSAAGVDEVACLVDFGIATDQVLASLELLLETKSAIDDRRTEVPLAAAGVGVGAEVADSDQPAEPVAELVARHEVTHLQCTPSLAAMLAADPTDRQALGQIGHLLVGGEALPTSLAVDLREVLSGRLTNMYGPTETTIWSLTHEIAAPPEGTVPIGTPIANTSAFVLDARGRRLPLGAHGELHIGGEGVARGYHRRAELTAERFVDRAGHGRVYATGDVARIHPSGRIEFAGRIDNQVKIRGHRIELGEIETVLDRHPDVAQSVVVARGDAGDPRLVGFVVAQHGTQVSSDTLRKHVGAVLPDVMVPSAVHSLDAFPLTPNGKIDRQALPADPGFAEAVSVADVTPPADDIERLVAEIWIAELERPVGRDDNFFDIGGHSLLAVKVFRRLSEATGAPLALTDVFRYSTVRTFAAHLGALQLDGVAAPVTAPAVDAPSGADRGALRRRVLARRATTQDGQT